MNRTLAARLARSKHQFDIVDVVDSEQVFGQDGGLIEQVFPIHPTAPRPTREVNRMRARVLAGVSGSGAGGGSLRVAVRGSSKVRNIRVRKVNRRHFEEPNCFQSLIV